MATIPETIRDLVAPVVMISANGLICLALYNRLAIIIARLRSFHKEYFDAQSELATSSLASRHDHQALQSRAENLRQQCAAITRRARLVRNAIMMLMLGALAMLACSLTLVLASVAPALGPAGLAFFVTGLLGEMFGISLALLELATALSCVELESAALEQLPLAVHHEDNKLAA